MNANVEVKKKFDTDGKSMHDLHWAGMIAISYINGRKDEDVHRWPLITSGFYDEVLAVSFYYTAHGEFPVTIAQAMNSAEGQRGLANTKTHLQNIIMQVLDPEGYSKAQAAREREMLRDFNVQMERADRDRRKQYAMQKQAVEREEKAKRDSFNSQHTKAPEGSVKELATKYGKSIGEIRRLKAAGELHTLVQS